MEEFVALDEKVVDIGMDSLEAIPARRVDRARLASLLCWLTDASRGAIALPSRSAMVAAMGELVTDLAPGRSTASLDSKM
jgi:hypothetical protein